MTARAFRSPLLALATMALATGCIVQPAGDADGYDVGADLPVRAAPAGTTVVANGSTPTGDLGATSVGASPPPTTAGPTPDPWHIGADPNGANAGPTPDPWDPGRARCSSTAGSTTAKANGTKQSK